MAVMSSSTAPVLVISTHWRLTAPVDPEESRVTMSPTVTLLWSDPALAMLGVGFAAA